MSTHQPQSSTSRAPLRPQTPVVSSPSRSDSLVADSQQRPETPLRLTASRTLYEVHTPELARSQASSAAGAGAGAGAAPTLQSPFNLPLLQYPHPPPSPQATRTPRTPRTPQTQRGAGTTNTHSPFVIHRHPNFRPQPRPRPRALASPPQSLPISIDSSRLSFHTPSYAQPPDVSMTPVHLPRLTYSPSTLQSPVAATPSPHDNLMFTAPGSDMSWSPEL